jgi:hypothetical protein
MVEFTVGRYGRLDVLFNNAGVESTKPVVEPAGGVDRIMAVNAKGVSRHQTCDFGDTEKRRRPIINVVDLRLDRLSGVRGLSRFERAVRLLTKSTALRTPGQDPSEFHPPRRDRDADAREVIATGQLPSRRGGMDEGEPISRSGCLRILPTALSTLPG